MNLHSLANSVVAVVNPNVRLQIQVSTGSTINPDGKRVPSYASSILVLGQVQPLGYRDIQQADALNIQGIRKTIFINGNVDGLVRVTNKGGDLITVLDGPNMGVYLVAQIEEAWADWCKALVTLQDGS
jgi:hypothetical protein